MTPSDDHRPFRARRLGWHKNSEKELAKAIKNRRESIRLLLTDRPRGVRWWEVSRELASDYGWLCLWLYLLDQDSEAEDTARELVKWTREYFFGRWRETAPAGSNRDQPPDVAYQHRMSVWQDEFVNGIVWASVIGDWQAVEELSRYPTDIVRLDVDQSVENRAWLLALAATLRGGDILEQVEHLHVIRGGRRRREKLLLDLLIAITTGNASSIACASTAYFHYYTEAELRQELITAKVAYDGTLLLKFALHLGFEMPVPERAIPHLICLNA